MLLFLLSGCMFLSLYIQCKKWNSPMSQVHYSIMTKNEKSRVVSGTETQYSCTFKVSLLWWGLIQAFSTGTFILK